jgi:hypothetical protein
MAIRLSRRDNANSFAALGVDNGYEHIVGPADRDETFLTVVVAQILFDHRERVIEDPLRQLESEFVTAKVDRRLALIPLEVIAIHRSNGCQ